MLELSERTNEWRLALLPSASNFMARMSPLPLLASSVHREVNERTLWPSRSLSGWQRPDGVLSARVAASEWLISDSLRESWAQRQIKGKM